MPKGEWTDGNVLTGFSKIKKVCQAELSKLGMILDIDVLFLQYHLLRREGPQ